jgi:iron-sulfur cluster assembly protein
MLTLTENASTIVKDLTAQQGGADTSGVRISAENPEQGLLLSAADQPQPGDQTVSKDGAVVYLDTVASTQLEDQVLDASLDDAGQVQFALAPQS